MEQSLHPSSFHPHQPPPAPPPPKSPPPPKPPKPPPPPPPQPEPPPPPQPLELWRPPRTALPIALATRIEVSQPPPPPPPQPPRPPRPPPPRFIASRKMITTTIRQQVPRPMPLASRERVVRVRRTGS